MNHNPSYSQDPFIQQSSSASCAIKCQQIILCCYGIYVTETDLCRIAKDNGWYKEDVGVHLSDNGKLLGCFGIRYIHSQKNGIEDIILERQSNHCVMVCLNHAKLSGIPDEYNQAAHGVLIKRIDDRKVWITNPSTGYVSEMYPMDTFYEAWRDSDFYMLRTTEKALFEYDADKKMMVEITEK